MKDGFPPLPRPLPPPPAPPPPTYRDGVRVLRCSACGRALLDGADEPLVYVREADLEALASLLKRQGQTGARALIHRLEQALGHRVPPQKRSRTT